MCLKITGSEGQLLQLSCGLRSPCHPSSNHKPHARGPGVQFSGSSYSGLDLLGFHLVGFPSREQP